jgi:hypothetical protein
MSAFLKDTVWIMHTEKGFYPIQPSIFCKPKDHGDLNHHVIKITDADGKVIWRRQDA